MDIGNKIRELRKEQKMSIKELAEMSQCTSSFISQLERNLANPSINTLKKISEILDVPLVYFFEQENELESTEDKYVIRKNQRKKLKSINEKTEVFLLTPDLDNNLEMHMIVIEPGGQSDKLYTNNAEEVGYVLSGDLTFYLGEDELIIYEGDSIYFPGHIPHGWKNHTNQPVVTLWVTNHPILKGFK
ncbi:XRE family transcriptional regulator [Sutcliffiella cohnii]|uniref:helix-turn-helix domain-containing protein n=1 Tax=Sutcliffiella cohnii TaxID=33932 RepID=UPI002E1A81FA|nr:XRE family transcriptional regulator [Sutcliffiella cohnii]